MAAVDDVCAGLIRHKTILLRELSDTNILDVLVKKGLFSLSDLELITGAADSDKCNYFVEVVSKQSDCKLNELCSVLEKECPKLTKELVNDRHRFILNGYYAADSAKENMVMSHNINRESPRSRRSVSQCSCNSVSRRSSTAASPMPMQLPPLNNTMEMYVEPVVEDISEYLLGKWCRTGAVIHNYWWNIWRTVPSPWAKIEARWRQQQTNQRWEKLASTLNAVGAGATKTGAKWRDIPIQNVAEIPRWAFSLEERRLATEERMAHAVESLAHAVGRITPTTDGILHIMTRMDAIRNS